MTDWAAKRFWKTVTVTAQAGGYGIYLDARPLKTPAKAALIVPTQGLAQMIAAEWAAQEGRVRPEYMPATRTANSAIDTVARHFLTVVQEVAGYGGTDLLCYHADGPQALCQRQIEQWDPLLSWAAQALGAPLQVTRGVSPIAQPAQSLERLHAVVAAQTPFQLAALHDLVAISGSLIIGLAVAHGHISAEDGFAISRLDETWQTENWGADDEAAALLALKAQAFKDSAAFYALCGF